MAQTIYILSQRYGKSSRTPIQTIPRTTLSSISKSSNNGLKTTAMVIPVTSGMGMMTPMKSKSPSTKSNRKVNIMKKNTETKFWYTIIIDPDGDPDFEDFEDEDKANDRLKELRSQGIPAVMGWTN